MEHSRADQLTNDAEKNKAPAFLLGVAAVMVGTVRVLLGVVNVAVTLRIGLLLSKRLLLLLINVSSCRIALKCPRLIFSLKWIHGSAWVHFTW